MGIHDTDPRISMRTIAKTIAANAQCSLDDLMGDFRFPELVAPRHEAWRQARAQGYTMEAIGAFFGKHHTSIMYGIRAAERRAAK